MSNFLTFLHQLGARFNERGVTDFATPNAGITSNNPEQASNLISSLNVSVLTNLSCLWIEGTDAKKFLQGQATCDVNEVQASESTFGQSRRGAHCNTKGRMIFDFVALSSINAGKQEAIGLIIEQDLLGTAQAALKKYMVFSKATLVEKNHLVFIGVSGPEAQARLAKTLDTEIPVEAEQIKTFEHGHVLSLSAERYLCLLDLPFVKSIWPQLSTNCHLGGQFQWDLADIQQGVGRVRKETSEAFIPQDLNFQLINGINFQKGCYIGQEVVARMQYRGKLKRHMRRAAIDAADGEQDLPAPGTRLFSADNEQSIGTLVQASPSEAGTIEILAVVTDKTFVANDVFLGSERTHKLQFLPLPYAIPN